MATTSSATKLVLIVEDDDSAAEVIKFFLMDAGFRAQVADDGQRATTMIARQRPDLILLDLHLPPEFSSASLSMISAHSNVLDGS